MLLEEFSTIFDRPEKIKKLREYILDLAIRGKLVPQDETDEPVSVLLERIREEKDTLIKEKKIKKEKSLQEISDDEIPYELPKSWKWVRLGQVVSYKQGLQVSQNNQIVEELDGYTRYLRIIDFRHDDDIKFIKTPTTDVFCNEDDLLMIRYGGTAGEVVTGKSGVFHNNMFRIDYSHNYINKEYIHNFLKLQSTRDILLEGSTSSTMPQISHKVMNAILIPLPPLNEQIKIVEKVSYLMEFCDKLEKQLEKKVKYGFLSAKSILNDVSNCSTYEELEETLRFIIDNFKDLTLADGAVGELKNTILSLAVRGKLVPQNDNDSPASVLLERIKEKKDRLVKEKKIKKENPLPEISEHEIPYDLPKGWQWVRLGDVGQVVGGGTPKTNNPEYFSDNEIVWLTPADLNGLKEKYIFKGRRYISKLGLEKSSAQLLPKGSVLFSSRAPIGYVAIAEVDLSTNQGFKSCVPYVMDTNEYIYYTLKLKGKEIDENASGTTFKEVSGKIVSQVIIPLPPLNEQKRIVEKVDILMKICDELELKIEKSKKYSEKLMESILKSIG